MIDAVTATSSTDAKELAEREAQAPMFSVGAVLRDVYAFLVHPNAPCAASSQRVGHTAPRFGAALLGRASGRDGGVIDTLAFVDRQSLETTTPLPPGWSVLDDATMLSALDHLGETGPLPLAALKALEHYIARKATQSWGEEEVGRLSVEFLTCFGAELTPRLDVHHRIRSTRLSDADVATLRAPPFSPYVDQNVIVRFQSQPPPVPGTSRAPLTAKADCAQPASVPAPTLPLPSAQGSAPPSPHAGHLPSLPLPPSPRAAYAPQASMMSTRALLFSSIA